MNKNSIMSYIKFDTLGLLSGINGKKPTYRFPMEAEVDKYFRLYSELEKRNNGEYTLKASSSGVIIDDLPYYEESRKLSLFQQRNISKIRNLCDKLNKQIEVISTGSPILYICEDWRVSRIIYDKLPKLDTEQLISDAGRMLFDCIGHKNKVYLKAGTIPGYLGVADISINYTDPEKEEIVVLCTAFKQEAQVAYVLKIDDNNEFSGKKYVLNNSLYKNAIDFGLCAI